MSLITSEKDLTNAERLYIERRRTKRNQRSSSEYYDVSLYYYKRWEKGTLHEMPDIELGKLSAAEICVLYRKRSKLNQTEVANAMKCSRVWVNMMENEHHSCADLLQFWESRNESHST